MLANGMQHSFDAGYPNLQRDKDGKVVPKPADPAKVNWLMAEFDIDNHDHLRRYGLRPGRGLPGRTVSDQDSLHIAVPCRITSAPEYSAACCPCSPPPSWPRPATSTADFGIRS